MYELKKIEKVFISKFAGTGPSSYKKRIYQAAVSQRLRNNELEQISCSCWESNNSSVKEPEVWSKINK